MANFIDPAALTEALHTRLNVNGEAAALDSIRKAHRTGPLVGDPVGLAKRHKVRADEQDDDEDLDADDMDMTLTDDERADLKVRRKARADANRKRSNANAALKMIKAIHGNGARPEDPDALIKAASTTVPSRDTRTSVQAIKRAQSNPLTIEKLFGSGNNNVPINVRDIERIVEQGRRQMRKSAGIPSAVWNAMTGPQRIAAMGKGTTATFKPQFPPNSVNGQWGGQIADTGAANNFNDEGTPSPAVGHAGGFTDSAISPSDARIKAAIASVNGGDKDTQVDAIKRDLWPQRKKDLARDFAARPAARVSDDIW